MQCPIDHADLLMMDRNGVEIDYCPKCRGVWLDRGELDKLIERAARVEGQGYAPQRRESPEKYVDEDRYDDDRSSYQHGKKKKSFLGDMFDIFD